MATRNITILYSDEGIEILRETPSMQRPQRVYSDTGYIIPPEIADLWLNFSKITVIDKRSESA